MMGNGNVGKHRKDEQQEPPNRKRKKITCSTSTSEESTIHQQQQQQQQQVAKKTTKEINNIFDSLFDSKKKQVPATTTATATSQKSTNYTSKSDLDAMKPKEWAKDGLGGKFNKEGYTGRTEQGVKIYKAHLFNKPEFGKSPLCPFDCDCCFI